MGEPKISVLMSVYNEETYLIRQAVDSILNQTFTDFEFILINDNPNSSRISDLLKEYDKNDSRIILITNPENLGLHETLRRGIKLCNTNYILRMDADDISFENRFQVQFDLITKYDYDLIGLNYQRIDLEGNIIRKGSSDDLQGAVNTNLLIKNSIPHSSFLVKKSALNKIGSYRDLFYAEDYDLLLRIISAGGIIYRTKEVLMQVRENPDGITMGNQIKQIISAMYARDLYLERVSNSDFKDSFSIENQSRYLSRYLQGYTEEKEKRSMSFLNKASLAKVNKNYTKAIFNYFMLIVSDRIFRSLFLQRLKIYFYSLKKRETIGGKNG
ncbi:glycosyltransferase [Hutsoniella sourekii]|uniref:glycosyltransferase n=1 Tax=Hutsoniella sourekii TaxID=87650 RepID=UPI0004B6F928|nr:glycosyltransferase [Hutsoniella sourekii]